MNFQTQLKELKDLNLPSGQFLVVGSGPMSIRGIRDSEDIDIIVTSELWNELIKKYPVTLNSWDVERVSVGENIEILNPTQSIFSNSSIVPVEEVYSQSDTFDGIKFLNLEHLKIFKKKLNREKDLKDIQLIDDYLYEQKSIKDLESEGYDKVWVYQAEPNEDDPEHIHPHDTKLKILKGSIRIKILSGGVIQDFSLKKDGDIEIYRNQHHSAIVGPDGCRYIVAEIN